MTRTQFLPQIRARTAGCAKRLRASFPTLYRRLKNSPRYKRELKTWWENDNGQNLPIVLKWNDWMQKECKKR